VTICSRFRPLAPVGQRAETRALVLLPTRPAVAHAVWRGNHPSWGDTAHLAIAVRGLANPVSAAWPALDQYGLVTTDSTNESAGRCRETVSVRKTKPICLARYPSSTATAGLESPPSKASTQFTESA
jgi:hypothetical protein